MFIKGSDKMAEFNRKEFAERLKKFRKEKGLSQENLAMSIGKNSSTIARFESGRLIPDAEQIFLLCNELEISECDLFNSSYKIRNNEESINPFGVDTLYIYYNGYYPTSKKFDKCKFKINIITKQNYCELHFVDYKTNKIYMIGHIETDNFMAFLKFNNYKPTSPRLECTQININIANSIDRLMRGVLFCTNGKYEPSCRKCFISKTDLDFTDEMLEELKITTREFEEMEKINIWYVDVENKEDFEQ